MSNINCGIGVLHVKRQILTYFDVFCCDVIYLFALVFIVSVDRAYKDVSTKKILKIVYGSVFMIWLTVPSIKQCTVPVTLTFDLWTHTNTHTQTDRQTDRVKTIPRNPLRGRGNKVQLYIYIYQIVTLLCWFHICIIMWLLHIVVCKVSCWCHACPKSLIVYCLAYMTHVIHVCPLIL